MSTPQLYPGQREHFSDVPRLRPGTRVRYRYAVNDSPIQYATCAAQSGIVVNLNATKYAHYPPGHPWACPDYATPVKWDHDNSITWVRSCCLEIPEPPQPSPPIRWPDDCHIPTPRRKAPIIRKRSPHKTAKPHSSTATSANAPHNPLQPAPQPAQLELGIF